MASVKWEAGSDSTIATTALNSKADDARAVSDEVDNSTDLYLFDDVHIETGTFGVAPSSGAVIELYVILEEFDGTGYEDGENEDPPSTNLVGVFNYRAVTAAQSHVLRHIPIPPQKFKYVLINRTGQTTPSSGNKLIRRPYRYQTG